MSEVRGTHGDDRDDALIGGREERVIEIVEHRAEWAERFEHEKARIEAAVGQADVRTRGAGSRERLAVHDDVDPLVEERDAASHLRCFSKWPLVRPRHVGHGEPLVLEGPVRRLALVGAVAGGGAPVQDLRSDVLARQIEAHGQIGLEEEVRARGVGQHSSVDRDADVPRAVQDVDPVERVARVADDPLVLLVPGVEGGEVEDHVFGQRRVRRPESAALGRRRSGPNRERVTLEGVCAEGDAGMKDGPVR